MGSKSPTFCKHCDERGTVRVKRGDTFVMEKCRKCGGSGFNQTAKTLRPKQEASQQSVGEKYQETIDFVTKQAQPDE